MDKVITITISGNHKCAKSHLAQAIARRLLSAGVIPKMLIQDGGMRNKVPDHQLNEVIHGVSLDHEYFIKIETPAKECSRRSRKCPRNPRRIPSVKL